MKKEDKKGDKIGTAKVYREYSRQMYTKLKAQFPKMRESEIVAKIIKEWESLNNTQKSGLQAKFEKQNFLTEQDILESSSSKKGQKSSNVKVVKKSAQPSSKPSNVKIFVDKSESKISDDSEPRKEDQFGDSVQDSESSKKKGLPTKTKTISKGKNSDYIQFFKYYYASTAKNHPRWTPHQITTIVRLLWKKRITQNKIKKTGKGFVKKAQILTGRRFFRKEKGLSGVDAGNVWRHLPYESKIYWDHESKGFKIDKSNLKAQVKLTSRSRRNQENSDP